MSQKCRQVLQVQVIFQPEYEHLVKQISTHFYFLRFWGTHIEKLKIVSHGHSSSKYISLDDNFQKGQFGDMLDKWREVSL